MGFESIKRGEKDLCKSLDSSSGETRIAEITMDDERQSSEFVLYSQINSIGSVKNSPDHKFVNESSLSHSLSLIRRQLIVICLLLRGRGGVT